MKRTFPVFHPSVLPIFPKRSLLPRLTTLKTHVHPSPYFGRVVGCAMIKRVDSDFKAIELP